MPLEMFDLSGKVAVVTGGYSGIGKGIAEGLAEAGANIVICARHLDRCQEACSEIADKFGVKCLPVRCDVTNTDEVNNLIETTVKEFGKVDILVNSAGIGEREKPAVEITDEDWDYSLDIDLKGPFLCCRAAAREMLKQGGGKIINVASVGGDAVIFRNMSPYCAAKAGLTQLTKVMALELARHNIQVNAIVPGYFHTPMNYALFSTEVGRKIIERKMPMGRLGNADEIKGLAIYLASPASSFMTGSCVVLDGGQSLT